MRRISCVSLRSFLACAPLLTACAGDIKQDSNPELAYQIAGELDWNDCAKQGEFCFFEGTRVVRFGGGAQGSYTSGTFTGGVWCNNRTFGVRFGRDNRCALESEEDTSHDAEHDTASGEHTGGATHDTTDPNAGMNHGAGMGTAVAADSVMPEGLAGFSGPQVMSTDEQPGGSDGTGSFRTRCDFSHMNNDDPIVYPGKPGAAHLHAYFGNSDADAYSTQDSLKNRGNSTCRGGTLNRSAYWAPALIDAQGHPVKPIEIDVYYKTGYAGVNPADVQPIPEGLRMIAGDAKSSAPQEHAYWGCKDNYIGKPATIPDCQSNDSLMMVVVYPQCWDGVNLDSSDHKSHLAYPMGNGCPASHPVALPEVTFKIYYKPPASAGGFRLASDMYDSALPGGYSAHADYFAAWDEDTMKTFVENCDNKAVDCHSHLLGDGRMLF